MSHATAAVEAPVEAVAPRRTPLDPRVISPSQMLIEPAAHAGRTGATLAVSLCLHLVLLVGVVLVPLLSSETLPNPDALKAFFVRPLEIAPPPPPPPPPSAAPAVVKAAPRIVEEPRGFVAPIEIPNQVRPEEGLDLGSDAGVPGGVEGGVPGGVVGGVVGGLPTALPPPPAPVVRIGGKLLPPRVVRRVEPVFPDLAIAARLSAIVVLEAQVDTRGYVKFVKVLSGHPLFDEPALEAVRQWRYQPLLLNGVPTGFILSVVINFNLRPAS